MAARRRCSPWPGRSGAVERAQKLLRASPSSYGPNALKSERNKAGHRKIRRGGALRRGRSNSSERFTAHGCFSPWQSVRRGLPRRRRVRWCSWRRAWSSGAAGGERWGFLRQWRVAELLLLLLLHGRRKEGEGAGDRMEGVVWGRGAASRLGGGGGRPRRAQRRRTAAMWPSLDGAMRTPHAGERGEGEAGRAAGWAEREAGLAQQRLSLFLFFLKFFSQFLSKFIWTI